MNTNGYDFKLHNSYHHKIVVKCKVSLTVAHMVQFLGVSLLMVFSYFILFYFFGREARKMRVHPIGTFKTCEY